MNMYLDTEMPTLEDIRARSVKPERHMADVIVLVNGHYVWKPRAQLRPDEPFAAFFHGDYRTVLEQDDPRIADEVKK